MEFRKNNALLAIPPLQRSMYCMSFEFSNALAMISFEKALKIWHKRLGHFSRKKLQKIMKNFCDIKCAIPSVIHCVECELEKSRRKPFSSVVSCSDLLFAVGSGRPMWSISNVISKRYKKYAPRSG
jgi:GAG-pre-integrase domain